MITEGSVLRAASEPSGKAVDVAPEGFEHPVYRSGLALVLELPSAIPQTAEEIEAELRPIEEPATEEAIVERPCEEPPIEERKPEEMKAEETPPALEQTQVEAEKLGAEAEEPAQEPDDAL